MKENYQITSLFLGSEVGGYEGMNIRGTRVSCMLLKGCVVLLFLLFASYILVDVEGGNCDCLLC